MSFGCGLPLWSHSAGVRFGSEYHSVDFARTLELVLGPVNAFSLAPIFKDRFRCLRQQKKNETRQNN